MAGVPCNRKDLRSRGPPARVRSVSRV